MSNQNPLIQNTAKGTINSVIELLGFVTAMLHRSGATDDNAVDGAANEPFAALTPTELAGLAQSLNCVKSALEAGFEQCPVDSIE
jgi:hypothetical protein